jgi:hypothetical protein
MHIAGSLPALVALRETCKDKEDLFRMGFISQIFYLKKLAIHKLFNYI